MLKIMKKIGVNPTRFIASGGFSKSPVWMQIMADILSCLCTYYLYGNRHVSGRLFLQALAPVYMIHTGRRQSLFLHPKKLLRLKSKNLKYTKRNTKNIKQRIKIRLNMIFDCYISNCKCRNERKKSGVILQNQQEYHHF